MDAGKTVSIVPKIPSAMLAVRSAAGIATAGRNAPMESAEDSVSIAWLVRSAELESAVTITVTVSSIVPRPYM